MKSSNLERDKKKIDKIIKDVRDFLDYQKK